MPKTPGGIALAPSLAMPSIGSPQRIELDWEKWEIVVVTGEGRFRIPRLEPRTFVTILRAVRNGQAPFISIGTERSQLPGHAKVTYAPLLKNTRAGRILYDADVQFKGIFASFPFGERYRLNRPGLDAADGYPGLGGDFMRFWITNRGIRLEERGSRLEIADHGMIILSETRLRGQVVADAEMEAYSNKLTDQWNALADSIPAFEATEELALATAIAFWIRSNNVEIDKRLWELNPHRMPTPEHSPLVLSTGGLHAGVSGGVCLTPEDKTRSAAAGRLVAMSSDLMNSTRNSGGPCLAIAVCFPSHFVVDHSGLYRDDGRRVLVDFEACPLRNREAGEAEINRPS